MHIKQQIKNVLRFWKLLEPFHKWFGLHLVFVILMQSTTILYAYLSSQILNSLVTKNVQYLVLLFGLYFIADVFEALLEWLTRKNREHNLDQNVHQHLQAFTFKKIFSLTGEQQIEDHSQLKLTIVSKGETSLFSIVDKITSTALPTFVLMVLTIGTLFIHNRVIALISFVIMVISFVWGYYFSKNHYPYVAKNRDNWNEQAKIRSEAFTHFFLVKLLNRSDVFIEKYLTDRLEKMKYHSMVTMRSATNSVLRNLFADLGSVTTFAVAVFLFLQGSYSIGTVYLIWSITSRVYWQMSSLSQVMRIIPQEYADAEKLFNLVDTEPSFNEGGRKIDSLEGDIVFSNLSFTYPKGDSPVLKNVSLSIPQGKRVAFVGGSGSGKTTLVKLLLRVYDYKEGSIKFGRDELRELDGGSIRERVGYVEQHVDLLDDTLKTNILIAVDKKHQKEAADELEEIAKKARITEFYHRLGEKKFDTVVGERGIKLSGGERQRVGIARAIIKNPDILIFDEATSSLDTENEKYVMEAIKEASADKTTIIIAHRLSTVKDADKIIVMDKGQVVGEGTHDELMQNSSYYRNLVEHQVLV